MPDYITIPNQPGASGSPTGAQVAADDVSGTGAGPYIQQVSIANLNTNLRLLLQELSILGLAQDVTTGRLRILIDAITATVTIPTSIAGTVNTSSTGTTLGATIAGFGPSGGQVSAASYLPLDLMTSAWGDTVRRNVS